MVVDGDVASRRRRVGLDLDHAAAVRGVDAVPDVRREIDRLVQLDREVDVRARRVGGVVGSDDLAADARRRTRQGLGRGAPNRPFSSRSTSGSSSGGTNSQSGSWIAVMGMQAPPDVAITSTSFVGPDSEH